MWRVFWGCCPPDFAAARHRPDMSDEATLRPRHPAPTLAPPADLELMRRAGAREPEAERALVTRLIGRANRLTHALLRNREDARDASQAALLGILRSTSSFRGESSVECWADRIVVRTALRLSRNSRKSAVSDFPGRPAPSIL